MDKHASKRLSLPRRPLVDLHPAPFVVGANGFNRTAHAPFAQQYLLPDPSLHASLPPHKTLPLYKPLSTRTETEALPIAESKATAHPIHPENESFGSTVPRVLTEEEYRRALRAKEAEYKSALQAKETEFEKVMFRAKQDHSLTLANLQEDLKRQKLAGSKYRDDLKKWHYRRLETEHVRQRSMEDDLQRTKICVTKLENDLKAARNELREAKDNLEVAINTLGAVRLEKDTQCEALSTNGEILKIMCRRWEEGAQNMDRFLHGMRCNSQQVLSMIPSTGSITGQNDNSRKTPSQTALLNVLLINLCSVHPCFRREG